MFQEEEFLHYHKALLRMIHDRQKWHHAKYIAKKTGNAHLLDTGMPKLQKDSFAWYRTLEKNIHHYLHAVLDLAQLEAEHMSYIGQTSDDVLTPHKIKQVIIIQLIAELGHTADELRMILKTSNDSVGSAVRLRRRIRWLEVKLEGLTKEPLMPTDVVTDFFSNPESSIVTGMTSRQVMLPTSPTFVASVTEGESLTSSEEDVEEPEEGMESASQHSQQLRSEPSASTAAMSPDAADLYWTSEHHQVEHSQLTNLFGPSLPFHSLDIHRSDSYVKEKGDRSRASLKWKHAEKEYADPNSEENALERLSVTVQEMMGRAYTAALESVPLESRRGAKEKREMLGKTGFHSEKIMSRMKGQQWMEKKFRRSMQAREMLVYHPPPYPTPSKLLLAKLSDDMYPPIPNIDNEAVRQRAKEMAPRFVNQHDLLKKTHLTLYELMFDVEKVKSKVDVRKSNKTIGMSTKRNDISMAPSATIVREPAEPGQYTPKTPVPSSFLPKVKPKMRKQVKDGSQTPRRLLQMEDGAGSSMSLASLKDRVYMTKSGWSHSRRMPSPATYITVRLERAKQLIAVMKSDTDPEEQKIACAKQVVGLGVSNAELITDLVSMISNSVERSTSMDLRFEVLKILLMLGFTEDAVIKELLVFISSSNHQVLCEMLRCLRKALSSPRFTEPTTGNGTVTPLESVSAREIQQDKGLTLLFISPTDSLLVHRLVQLCQCTSPELSFYAAACLRKVRIMPPPPPLPPSNLPDEADSSRATSVSFGYGYDSEPPEKKPEKNAYQIELQEYEELLEKLAAQDKDTAKLIDFTFRRIAKTETPFVVDALHELIEGIGSTDDELFKIAYDLIVKSPAARVRATVIRLLAGAFVRLIDSQPPGIEFRLNEFHDILIQRLINDPDKQVCTECARTFYKIGLYEKVSETVLKRLDNKLAVETKMQAIQCAVGLRIRGSRIIRALVDLLELDPSDGVRIAACRALSKVGTTDRRALDALRERHEKTQGVVAREAGRALAILTAPSSNAAFNSAYLEAK